MIRLLLAQLRHSPAVFSGPFLTAIVTAVFVQLAAIFWWSVVTSSGQDAFAATGDPAGAATFSTLGLFILVFGVGLPAIIAFTSVGRGSVALLRGEYARWRLAGVTPGQVVSAVVLQTVLLIVPASLIAAVAVNVATAPDGSGGASMLALVGILTALVAVAGPLIYPPTIRLWTRLLAPEHAPAVFLARRSSSADGTTAAAIITPVLIAGSLLSGYFSGAGTYKAAIELIGRDYSINLLQGLILFGPAAVIGLVAGLMGVLTRSGPDARAATLLRTVGATPKTLLAIPAIESVIYAVTTLAFSAAVVLLPTVLYAVGFANSQGLQVPIVCDLRAALVLTIIAAAVVFLIRAIPAIRRATISERVIAT